MSEDFRKNRNFDLRPVFISLGLPNSSFKAAALPRQTSFLDAVLNADDSRPNGLWLFKGSDYYLYNLETGEIDDGPRAIAGNFGGNTLPQLFRSQIHSAIWGGPAFPNFRYLFKDEMFIRLNSDFAGGSGDPDFVPEKLWKVDFGPRGILGAWATGVWANPDGKWRTPGVPVALHGLGTKFHGMIHFFKDGQYVRHNLLTGGMDAGPMAIKDAWNLPDGFENRIDMCFYGTGQNEEDIYFISDLRYVLYDFRLNQVIDSGLVEERFPAFVQFFGRPQLFLAEYYRLETYIGPTMIGHLIDTRNILPGQETKTLLVTETIDSSTTSLASSILESRDSEVIKNFNNQIDKRSESEEGSDQYRYHMKAGFHGDASATSLWGGEVNASLDVQGGSDSLRSKFADSTFQTIGSQVTEAEERINQRTYSSNTEIKHIERVLRQEEFVLKNDSDHARIFQFFQQLEPYITLLVLTDVRIAYTDATRAPTIVEMSRLSSLLNDKIADEGERKKITQFIAKEYSAVKGEDNQIRSLIQDEDRFPGTVMLIPNPTSTFIFQHANGDIQKIVTKGLIIKKAKDDWIRPTLSIIAVEVSVVDGG